MNFVKQPYLPDNDASLCIIDKNAEICSLKDLNIIRTTVIKNVLEGIDTHPDMCVCHLENNKIVVSPDSYQYYNEILSDFGFEIIKGDSVLSPEYPSDIAYNCVLINGKLFHNLKYTDKKILEFAQDNNYERINVKQGYTKCSTLIVDSESVITSDAGLYKVYINNGIKTLYVSNEKIKLRNFNCGFIGGCGGLLSKNKMAFFGDVKKHPDYNRIREFLSERNIEIICICEGEISDYGSIIPLIHK